MMIISHYIYIASLFISTSLFADQITSPDCRSGWVVNMAFAKLKNEGIYTSADWNEKNITSKILFSHKEGTRFKQMYEVDFTFANSTKVFVINYADNTECSLSTPEVYVVKKLKR